MVLSASAPWGHTFFLFDLHCIPKWAPDTRQLGSEYWLDENTEWGDISWETRHHRSPPGKPPQGQYSKSELYLIHKNLPTFTTCSISPLLNTLWPQSPLLKWNVSYPLSLTQYWTESEKHHDYTTICKTKTLASQSHHTKAGIIRVPRLLTTPCSWQSLFFHMLPRSSGQDSPASHPTPSF